MIVRALIVAFVVVAAGASAQAAYMFNWDIPQPHMVFVPDANDVSTPGADILSGIWWGQDSNYNYFRMDLEARPNGGDADVYGIYIADATPGPVTSNYSLPQELNATGIDWFTTSMLTNDLLPPSTYAWNGGGYTVTPYASSGLEWQQLAGPGGHWSLEWKVPISQLPSSFTFYGAIIDQYYESYPTVDITSGGQTPEPATLALLGLGLGGILLKRRRK